MIFLVRKIVKVAGERQYRDQQVNTERLSIGRGTDQDLLLPSERVAFRHAEINVGESLAEIRAFAATGITVNGHSCTVAALGEGDQMLIGGYRLVVIRPPAEHQDFAITVEQLEQPREEVLEESDFVTGPERLRWLRKRPWAWTGFLLVLLLGLGAPGWVAWQGEARESLRAAPLPLPDDRFWFSGEMSRAHQFIGHQCEQCHRAPFERVPNSACESCHEDMGRHTAPVGSHPDVTGDRCADCHREHNGREGVVIDHQKFCTDCHADLSAFTDEPVDLKNVGDFGKAHPEFRVRLLRPRETGQGVEWHRTERLELDASLRETGGLEYDHQVHLADKGVENETGAMEVMECADCHQPEPGGAGFLPIRMEPHCSRCHSLAFDPEQPERTLPHAEPDIVIQSLREYYSRRFIQDRPGEFDVDLDRPGAPPAVDVLQEKGVAWVEERTRETAAEVFERRVCDTCHEVTRTETEERVEWSVEPVRINRDYWLDSARFHHEKHDNMDCVECHDAPSSEQASDILMPSIDTCRDCHGGAHAEEKLQSTCITCHRFHYQQHGKLEMP